MAKVFKVTKQHSEIVSKSTLFKTLKYIDSNNPETPVLIMDGEMMRRKVSQIGSGIRNSKVFYAVKAHPDKEVLRFMSELGLGFEIASEGELAVLEALAVDPKRIITSNPMKSPKFLRACAAYGVNMFSYDTDVEVEKMAAFVPGASVYVRLSVPNEGSEWPLSRKYGTELDDALKLLLLARDKGLKPVGITFHVGSQCVNVYNWNSALYKARELWDRAKAEGLELRMIDIGGGYPINYTRSVATVTEIEKNIDAMIAEQFPDGPEIYLEPGRSMVGDAGIFVASVIGKALRLDERWLYLDVGVFNGLMESVGGIKYTYILEEHKTPREKHSFVLAGPSCDSFDVIQKDLSLEEPEVGELVLIVSAGAYTISYASEFNGFSIPKTIIL